LEAALEAAQEATTGPAGDLDALVDQAIAGLQKLQQRLASADGRIARGALQAIIDRIDLEFEHSRGPKMIRSHFSRGIVKFKSYNLDHSDWPELAELPDLGETLARRIVESRAEAGPFGDHGDLLRVNGIGPRTLEKLRPYLMPMPDQDAVAGGGNTNAVSL
jgi:competence protein ComEA